MKSPGYDLRPVTVGEVRGLCERYHGYGSCGASATYAFGVYEDEEIVAGYLWQPPPPGASRSVCPEQPAAVLALSRMVAVPRSERRLNHVSKPLRRQMRTLIDRGRWPVLVTYSDEGQGHTGHVYRCSGWEKTRRSRAVVYEDACGRRRSRYSGGMSVAAKLHKIGHTYIQRWEHWACPRGEVSEHMARNGWRREPIPGKVWRSGRQAHRWVQQ